MLIDKYRTTTTPSSGVASGNTKLMRGKSFLIYVKALTATSSFDFSLTDKDGDVVYESTGNVGTLRDNTPFLLEGIYTWALANAVDELHTIKIQAKEEV